jgi:membrane protein DedA with SNARE-associated domain
MSPADTLQVFGRYSLVILPALVVAEQFGIPVPAVPALLGFGALVAHGQGSIPVMLGTLAVVALTVDFAWYEFGRRRGARVLTGLCRLSLEPDFCVRRAQNVFARFGASAMLVAKFVPDLTTIVPPLAGVVAVGRVRFGLSDLAGVLLWAGLWIGVGYAFSDAVAVIVRRVAALGLHLGIVLGAVLGTYILVKYLRRRLYLQRLRTASISPEALKLRLDAGESITIVDLRTSLDVAAVPHAIPGSLWVEAEHIDQHEAEILRVQDLVLYCS